MKILNYAKNKIYNIKNKNVATPIACSKVIDEFRHNLYKAECVKALNSFHPYELAFALDKNGKCLGRFVGNQERCLIENLPKDIPIILIHGHPQGVNRKTLPVSLEDLEFMNNNNVEKIVAFDKFGAQSYLQKGEIFTKLTSKQLSELKHCYINRLLKIADKSELEKFSSLISYCRRNSKNCDMVKQELAENLEKLQYKENANLIIDEFWQEVASKYNLIYFSNFK